MSSKRPRCSSSSSSSSPFAIIFNCHIAQKNSWFGTVILFKSSHLFAQSTHNGCGIKCADRNERAARERGNGRSCVCVLILLSVVAPSDITILFISFQCHIHHTARAHQYPSACSRGHVYDAMMRWHYIAIHKPHTPQAGKNQYTKHTARSSVPFRFCWENVVPRTGATDHFDLSTS